MLIKYHPFILVNIGATYTTTLIEFPQLLLTSSPPTPLSLFLSPTPLSVGQHSVPFQSFGFIFFMK